MRAFDFHREGKPHERRCKENLEGMEYEQHDKDKLWFLPMTDEQKEKLRNL
jgi:hypothetical protein